jgi:hypothetical protein
MTQAESASSQTESASSQTESAESANSLTLTELKARRGWLFSVIYLGLILGLIFFLSFVEIVEKNRDVLVGILGVLTGSISSMIAVASGRDPAEIEELKGELSSQQADRAALIARLRDAQISLQLKSDQVTQLQTLMISELAQLRARQLTESDVELDPHIKAWLPDEEKK